MKKKTRSKQPSRTQVAIIMGSESDLPTMSGAGDALRMLEVGFEMSILSAHRTPDEVAAFAKRARSNGFAVIIAGAGGAAHLPGMAAAHTELPVIGVPVPFGPLHGTDALLSIVQMPKGVPVATVAISNSWNAGILAAQMLGCGDAILLDRLAEYKEKMRRSVLGKRITKSAKR